MRRALPFLALLILAGCRQTSSTTEVREDGTFSRAVKFTAGDVNAQSKLKMADVFELPKGNGWTVKQTENPDPSLGTVADATNSFPFGTEISDIGLKLKGKVVLVNSVKVVETSPGHYEYTETFTWKGEADTDNSPRAKFTARLDELLGKNPKITAAQKEEFAIIGAGLLTRFLFGPPEPHLSLAISSPEFFARKARASMGAELLKAAERIFGDALDTAARKAFITQLLDPEIASGQAEANAPEPPSTDPEETNDDQPTTLTMVVKMPGTITETNGLTDPISGEVYWTMFRESAEQAPVTIFARSKK